MSFISLVMVNKIYDYIDENIYINEYILKLENILENNVKVKSKIQKVVNTIINELSEEYIYKRNEFFDKTIEEFITMYNNNYMSIQSLIKTPEKKYYINYVKSLDFLKNSKYYDYSIKQSKKTKKNYYKLKNIDYMINNIKCINKDLDHFEDLYTMKQIINFHGSLFIGHYQKLKKIFSIILNYFDCYEVLQTIVNNSLKEYINNVTHYVKDFTILYDKLKSKNSCLIDMLNNSSKYIKYTDNIYVVHIQ